MGLIFFIIIVVIILILIDIYSKLRVSRLALRHLIITNNYYEKLLLERGIIKSDDIAFTRHWIKEGVSGIDKNEGISEKDYETIKSMFLADDDQYYQALISLVGEGLEGKKRKVRSGLSVKIYITGDLEDWENIFPIQKKNNLINKIL